MIIIMLIIIYNTNNNQLYFEGGDIMTPEIKTDDIVALSITNHTNLNIKTLQISFSCITMDQCKFL